MSSEMYRLISLAFFKKGMKINHKAPQNQHPFHCPDLLQRKLLWNMKGQKISAIGNKHGQNLISASTKIIVDLLAWGWWDNPIRCCWSVYFLLHLLSPLPAIQAQYLRPSLWISRWRFHSNRRFSLSLHQVQTNIMLSLLCYAPCPLLPATNTPSPLLAASKASPSSIVIAFCLSLFRLSARSLLPKYLDNQLLSHSLGAKEHFSTCSTLTLSSSPVSYIAVAHFWMLVWTGASGPEPKGHWRQSPSWWLHWALKPSFLPGPLKERIKLIRADNSEEPE